MATNSDKKYLDQDAQNQITALQQSAQSGAISWDDAHNQAEQIRGQYGYSGGFNGDNYSAKGSSADTSGSHDLSWGSSTWKGNDYKGGPVGTDYLDNLKNNLNSQAPTYTNGWGEATYQDLLKQIVGMNYTDWMQGDTYKGLQNRYTENGQRAMQDTLGQVSARTGGYASSYATAAGQQAFNDYMSKLEDAARAMYSNERGELVENAGLARNYADFTYGRFRDDLGQWNTDRDYNTNLNQALYGYEVDADNTAYNRSQQEYSNTWGREQDEYNKNLDKAQTLAQYGDFSGYKALGYSDDEIQKMAAQYVAMQNRGTGRGGGGSSKEPTSDAYKDVLKKAQGFNNPDDGASYVNAMINSGRITPEEGAYIKEVMLGGVFDASITNKFGTSSDGSRTTWIDVPGYGRVSPDELETLVSNGKVVEEVDERNRHTYYVPSKKK